jgi:hypothetical protein
MAISEKTKRFMDAVRPQSGKQQGEQPPDLTPDDEAILSAAWGSTTKAKTAERVVVESKT